MSALPRTVTGATGIRGPLVFVEHVRRVALGEQVEIALEGRRCVVLGAGGAARAVVTGLQRARVAEIDVRARRVSIVGPPRRSGYECTGRSRPTSYECVRSAKRA